MNHTTLFIIALALSCDAMAVAISRALSCPRNKLDWLNCGLIFGFAQGIMPVIGFYLAKHVAGNLIQMGGNLVTAIILGLIGIKMISDALDDEKCVLETNQSYFGVLAMQSIATSIDAMAVGVSFYASNENILFSACVIAVVTSVVCIISHIAASAFHFEDYQKSQAIAGGILILVAIKSLLF